MKECKVLYVLGEKDDNILINGLLVPKKYFQMFTCFLAEEVYKMPIKYEWIDDLVEEDED